MSKFERLRTLEQLFVDRCERTPREIREKLEVSTTTVKRYIIYLRDQNGHQIEWDKVRGVYCHKNCDTDTALSTTLKYTFDEIIALSTLLDIMENLSKGLLQRHLQPIRQKVMSLLKSESKIKKPMSDYIRLFTTRQRTENPQILLKLMEYLVSEKRISLTYHARHENLTTERVVSPQKVVNYRFNWYLIAYCHEKHALRTFSVDRIIKTKGLKQKKYNVSDKELNHFLYEGYGIYSGKKQQIAKLKFSAQQAPWVANTTWHSKQKSYFKKGSFFLEFPYFDEREVAMDILRYGSDVEVLSPLSLKNTVIQRLRDAVKKYEKN